MKPNPLLWTHCFLLLGLGLACTSAVGCERGSVDEHVDKLRQAPDRLKAEMHDAVQDVKRGADKIEQQLPPAGEVRADLAKAGDRVETKLHDAGERAKHELHQVRDSVREQLDSKR
ncbi:MAG TPA: hypothetical protein VHZ95_07670 [Polyangiales bacterium]|nr:hypothetical protein [Polyangiales bacterium]